MQIVINIDDEDYDDIALTGENTINLGVLLDLREAVRKGTPLPKGHGRLIDVGQCDRKLFYQQCGGADSLITVKSAFDMLVSLQTIIEADTESEDKE